MSNHSGPTSFMDDAMLRARSISAARQDLPHYIFPVSSFQIDEHLISGIKNSLYKLVFNIERLLLRKASMDHRIGEKSLSYPILLESGLLNDSNVLDIAQSLFRYHNLYFENEKTDKLVLIDDKLSNHIDSKVRKCAHALALAHSRFQSLGLGDYYEVPPMDLHRLTWRIVATFEIIDKVIDPSLLEATQIWLAEHNEAETIAASSAKLTYLLRVENDALLKKYWHYTPMNTSIFIALLEYEAQIDRKAVLNILSDRSPLLCALLFRAVGMKLDLAIENILYIFMVDKNEAHNGIIAQIIDEYMGVTTEAAKEKLQIWAQSLSYPMAGDT